MDLLLVRVLVYQQVVDVHDDAFLTFDNGFHHALETGWTA